jgi:uncharacterized protein YecE (DUF72 family)
MAEIRVGISGWRYPGWRGVFYPDGLPQRQELAFAARHFDSIELNGSFYSLQRPELYTRWYEETPPGFVFAVKAARFITHMKKLRDIEAPLANFFASGVLALGDKLGPILWQFPEQLGFDARFEAFFRMLPQNTSQAAELAKQHDRRLIGRSYTRAPVTRRLRHAVEVRSRSFCVPDFVRLLRKYGIAWVVADTAGRWPLCEDVTTDFVYVRLHGDVELYRSGYSEQAIERWAKRVRAWSSGREPEDAARVSIEKAAARKSRDVYVYFDNDAKVHAPFDAIALLHALGMTELSLVHPAKARPARARLTKPSVRGSVRG